MKAAALKCELGNSEGMDLVFYIGIRDFAFRQQGAQLVQLGVKEVISLVGEREPEIKVGSEEQVAEDIILLLILI